MQDAGVVHEAVHAAPLQHQRQLRHEGGAGAGVGHVQRQHVQAAGMHPGELVEGGGAAGLAARGDHMAAGLQQLAGEFQAEAAVGPGDDGGAGGGVHAASMPQPGWRRCGVRRRPGPMARFPRPRAALPWGIPSQEHRSMPSFKSLPLRGTLLAVAMAAALGTAAPLAWAEAPPAAAKAGVDIPYEEFTLPNGLRVVVHTDRKAPIVAVNIWYHVGSKAEPVGRSGLAHLFEHLMFQTAENHDREFFAPFKQVGVTDQNGTTNTDRTNYFQNVPTPALDTALWMESDRMGHLLGAVDQAALDEQRGVVQNEKRQGENQPYGQAWTKLMQALYPKDHPYHHTVIGSMNDLDAAALEDVHAWFRAWYGPNNAVLVLAGDIDVETAKEKVAKYFGHIPAGPDMAQPRVDVARRTASTRETMEDKVPQ